ncbi:hypothetical protein SAMN04488071_3524 [Kordiimonas lacus]|uniref:PAS fold-containing protein n=1 Tax=Kordiimonas lacus TaxID=637679 RepID=A0A1G7EX64_9PROT|nr:hypothetical protein [Kordiimonas lacus]SDE68252.1 hypothetical protein SAMN04488071_3524 [Kordiimonas lacus]
MTVEVGIEVGKVSAFDMNALDSRIRELVAYARERDGEDRTTLFRSLVDMFLTGKAPVKEPTRAQLLDVIEALIPHVEPDSRRTVSEILAGQAKPPMDLVHRLVRDRASLMEDLLKNAPFDEDDIIELIGQTGREHHQILATRSDLSANVWIALARAAPAAPPFEGRSTLALWRDDLGAQPDTADASEAVNEQQDTHHIEEIEPRRVAAGGGSAAVMTAGSTGDNTGFAATVTRLRPEGFGPVESFEKKAASLRILRTDEDLIAERMSDRINAPETKMVGTSDQGADGRPNQLTDTVVQSSTPVATGQLTETAPDTAASTDGAEQVKQRFLRDPGPGGWAWRSDRDGFITLVSPFAAKIYGGAARLIGTAMLDMLGLNTKLDHPVSRAFQRRSTIHDAPISLPQLDTQLQHWTLEAAPVFNPTSGIFEGFEGILTPVKPASETKSTETLTYDQPLFLDDEHDTAAPATRRPAPAPAAFTDSPSVLQSAVETREADLATDQRMAESEATSGETAGDAPKRNPIADMINSTAAAMVREAVSDALSPLSPQQEATRYGKQSAEPDDTSPQAPETDAAQEEILATLQLLEESLARLTDAGEKGAIAQVRLQSEIATACARALKSQLKK